MARRHGVGAEIARRLDQVMELDVLVAGHARNRGFAMRVAFGERLDHLFAEPGLIIEDVMRNADPRRHVPRVVNVAPRATCAAAMGRRAVIVKLHGDADDVIALPRQQRGDDGGIHAPRHRDDDARALGRFAGDERGDPRPDLRRRNGGAGRLRPVGGDHERRPDCEGAATRAAFARAPQKT